MTCTRCSDDDGPCDRCNPYVAGYQIMQDDRFDPWFRNYG